MGNSRRAHKIRLAPTWKQESYLRQAVGVARFTWNWALAAWNRQYEAGEKPSALKLKREFNAIKPVEFPWMYRVTKYASQQPFIFLGRAFQAWFRKKARRPRFKRKGVHDSFYVGNDHIQVEGKRIRLPHVGWIKMREELRLSGSITSATVSRTADKWFVSIGVECDQGPDPCESQAGVGVDLGVKRLATLSTGDIVEGPKPLKRLLRKLRREQRRLSRKQKGSRNREKARLRVARLHYKIACIRQEAIHQLTTRLTEDFGRIAIEDLNVKGMLKNHRLARAIADMGFYEFRRQLVYKSELRGNYVKLVNPWFPSTKRCSRCHALKDDMPLGERTYRCEHCGLEKDRDENSALNLLSTVSSTGCEACGEDSAGSPDTG